MKKVILFCLGLLFVYSVYASTLLDDDVTVNGALSLSNSTQMGTTDASLATKKYVDDEIADIETGGGSSGTADCGWTYSATYDTIVYGSGTPMTETVSKFSNGDTDTWDCSSLSYYTDTSMGTGSVALATYNGRNTVKLSSPLGSANQGRLQRTSNITIPSLAYVTLGFESVGLGTNGDIDYFAYYLQSPTVRWSFHIATDGFYCQDNTPVYNKVTGSSFSNNTYTVITTFLDSVNYTYDLYVGTDTDSSGDVENDEMTLVGSDIAGGRTGTVNNYNMINAGYTQNCDFYLDFFDIGDGFSMAGDVALEDGVFIGDNYLSEIILPTDDKPLGIKGKLEILGDGYIKGNVGIGKDTDIGGGLTTDGEQVLYDKDDGYYIVKVDGGYITQLKTIHRDEPATGKALVTLAGDSIIAGTYANFSPPDYLEKALDKYSDVDVANQGTSGDDSADVLTRINTILAEDAKQLGVNVGINGIYTSVTEATYISNMEDIIDGAKTDGTPIVISGIRPDDNLTIAQETERDSKNVALQRLCFDEDVPFSNTDYYLQKDGDTRDLKPEYAYTDGLHLNDAGNKKDSEIFGSLMSEQIITAPTTMENLKGGNVKIDNLKATNIVFDSCELSVDANGFVKCE